MTATATAGRARAAGAGGNVNHLTCCDDDAAMCGADVSREPWCGPGCRCVPCPLCRHVNGAGLPCPVTGCEGGWPA